MSKPKAWLLTKAALLVAVLAVVLALATSARAQSHRHRERGSATESERPAAPVSADKRDAVVAASGASMGKPYWLVLAQCGGIYFKLNVLYTDIAVHARVTKPDPTLNNEVTKKLNDAIRTATSFYTAAERFLMTDRGIERTDAVLIYNDQARAAGDRFKAASEEAAAVNSAISAALSAAKSCPVLYQACQAAYPKACSDQLPPVS
jgi:hypothetical protein